MNMRFRLWQLMTLVTLVAISICAVDCFSYNTIQVEVSSPTVLKGPNKIDAGYAVIFSIRHNEDQIEGLAGSSFGFNSFLEREITSKNLERLSGSSFNISHSWRSFPWVPATKQDVEDELARHFDKVIVFPNDGLWHRVR